jgi:hypothetical protein
VTFHCARKYSLSKTALNNWVRFFSWRLLDFYIVADDNKIAEELIKLSAEP